jgi:hypothetical protein
MLLGTDPENFGFRSMYHIRNDDIDPIVEGRVPVKAFRSKRKSSNRRKVFPKLFGNFPDIRFDVRFRPINPLNNNNSGGSVPLMPLDERSIPTTVLVSEEQTIPLHTHSSLPPLVSHDASRPKLKASVARVHICTVLASDIAVVPNVLASSADWSHPNASACDEPLTANRSVDAGDAAIRIPDNEFVTGAAVICDTGLVDGAADVSGTKTMVGICVGTFGATDGTSLLPFDGVNVGTSDGTSEAMTVTSGPQFRQVSRHRLYASLPGRHNRSTSKGELDNQTQFRYVGPASNGISGESPPHNSIGHGFFPFIGNALQF